MSGGYPLELVRELRESHPSIYGIFMEGSCFRLFSILSVLFPTAEPWYSDRDGHWITRIDERFYDIGGELDPDYVSEHGYKLCSRAGRLENAYMLNGDRSGSYDKYLSTGRS